MRIGIDVRSLSNKRSGINTYLLNILSCLNEIDKDNYYFLYSNRDFQLPFKNPKWQKRVGVGLIARIGTLWLMINAHQLMNEDKIDVFWGAQQVIPVGLSIPRIITVYDLVWHYFPQTMSIYNLFVHRILCKYSLRHAKYILTISKSVKDQIIRIFGISSQKIEVAYCAAGPTFTVRNRELSETLSKAYNVSNRYVLSVGTIEPRKNTVALLKAFKYLIEKHKVQHQLLIVGAKGWKTSSIMKSFESLGLTEDRVKFLGYVPEEHMSLLYSGAELFIYPSLYEGFGIPILEAMACGCPVIASDIPVFDEIAGQACLRVNPSDTPEFAKIIFQLLTDEKMRQDLRNKGLEKYKEFSWKMSAEIILNHLNKIESYGDK